MRARRAERFGSKYVEPDIASCGFSSVLSRRVLAHLRSIGELPAAGGKRREGKKRQSLEDNDLGDFVRGIDTASEAEAARRAARAAKFGIKPLALGSTEGSDLKAQTEADPASRLLPPTHLDAMQGGGGAALLGPEAVAQLQSRRARASRFGTVAKEDMVVAQAAFRVLGCTLLLGGCAVPEGSSESQPADEEGDAAGAAVGSGPTAPAAATEADTDGQRATEPSTQGTELPTPQGSLDAPPVPTVIPESGSAPSPAAQASLDVAQQPAVSRLPKPEPGEEAGKEGTFAVRPEAVHLRGPGYLPLSTRDLMSHFRAFRPSWVEWLNGVAANVLFHSRDDAARAMAQLTSPIPKCSGIPSTHPAWRVSTAPLTKSKTDKWGPAGDTVTVYARYATDQDTRDRAKRTAGARTYGTWGSKAAQRVALSSSAISFAQAMAGDEAPLEPGADVTITLSRRGRKVGPRGRGASRARRNPAKAAAVVLQRQLHAALPSKRRVGGSKRQRAQEEAHGASSGEKAAKTSHAAAPTSGGSGRDSATAVTEPAGAASGSAVVQG